MPYTIRIAKGKNIDLTPYSENSPYKNLLNHSAMNPAYLTDLSSLKRALTHLPILAGLPLGEAVRPPKCMNNFSSTTRSPTENWMLKGLSFPNIRSRKVFTISSKVTIRSPTEKKNVWKEGDQRQTKCLSPLTSRKPSKFLVIVIDFRMPAHSRYPTKLASLNSFVGKFRPRLIELTSLKPKFLIRLIMNKTC